MATLRAGQNVQVKSKGAENWKGTFLVYTKDTMSIHAKHGDIKIQRAEIKKIKVKSGMNRLRHTLIGAGIGAAAAALIAGLTVNDGEVA